MKFHNFSTLAAGLSMSLLLGFTSPQHAQAQGTPADYERADRLEKTLRTGVTNLPYQINWHRDNERLIYVVNRPQGKEFMQVNVRQSQKSPAFDHARLAAALSKASGEEVKPEQLPIASVMYGDNGQQLKFQALGRHWICELDSYQLLDSAAVASRRGGYWGDRGSRENPGPVSSPDSVWEAYIKNENLYLRRRDKSAPEKQLSFDGSPGEPYSPYLQWSPDGAHLVAMKTRPAKDRTLYLLESSPASQLQPILQTRNYLKPGDALEQRQPVLFSVTKDAQHAVPWELIEDQYQLSAVKWWKDSRGFTFEYNRRGHQEYAIIEVDAQSGKARHLVREQSPTFIDYSGKKYRYDLGDGQEIIWASERDGWNHLYLIDAKDARVKNQITKGDWVVRKVIQVDEQKREIIFEGSGKESGQDPYFIQYYRVNFDGSGLKALTRENANHQAVFSADFSSFVDTYSRLDQLPKTVLRSTKDGSVLMELETADISGLEGSGWRMPEVFSAKGRDGQTDIWGMIVRPTNFDPAKSYPVIEYIYAGPHSSFVPKSFSANPSGVAALAELGFIVVQIDGMGTSNRSKAFHDVCYQNLRDAGFPDRIAWMQSAAEKYPYMDLSRVGIYGTSAGGQSSAGALLFHPDFYKVAVSSCGCHDNRMDKIWWNEQWMGKMGEHYAASSNTVHAGNLQGKLMLIVGELDDNVDPASTFQFADALIKAKKDFDFIMVPGMGHSSGGDFGERKRRDYFVRHLLGVNPPVWEGQKAIF